MSRSGMLDTYRNADSGSVLGAKTQITPELWRERQGPDRKSKEQDGRSCWDLWGTRAG